MNEIPPRPSDPNNAHNAPGSESAAPAPGSGRCVFEPIASAFRQGAKDAREATEQAIPRVKAAASKAACHLAYGVAFAGAFHYAALKTLCPESIKTGIRHGLSDGIAAGEKFANRFKQPRQDATSASSPEASGAAQPQPGTV
jgi:hypothetical protein